MRNVNICLIILISLLFLLINLYGLLEILRFLRLKQLRELEEEKYEREWHTERDPKTPVRISFPTFGKVETTTHRHRIHQTTKHVKHHRTETEDDPTIGPRIRITTPSYRQPTTTSRRIPHWQQETSSKPTTTTSRVPATARPIRPGHDRFPGRVPDKVRKPVEDNTAPSRHWPDWAPTEGRKTGTTRLSRIWEVPTTARPRLAHPVPTRPIPGRGHNGYDGKRTHYTTRPRYPEEPRGKVRTWDTTQTRGRPSYDRETTERRPELTTPRTVTAQTVKAPEWFMGPMVVQRTTTQPTTTSTVESTTQSTTETTTIKIQPKSTTELSTSTTRIHITTKSLYVPPLIPSRTRIEILPTTRAELTTDIPTTKLVTSTVEPEYSTDDYSYEADGHSDEDLLWGKIRKPVPPKETPIPYHIEGDWRINRQRLTTTTTEQPTEPNSEITIVTALMDIGRGDWWEYRRPLEKYHEFMENLLALSNNMVIFTDRSSYDFVHKYRKNIGLMGKTKVHLITMDDLPLSRHLPYAQKIIEDEHKNEEMYKHDPSMKHHPEAKSAEYDVVVNSKTYFLYNATLEDPFGTDFFVWIDAGYGHGNQSVFPYDGEWKPTFPRGKISMIKLTPERDPITRYKIDTLYRHNWSVVSGGFIAGDKRAIGQLYTIVHNKFVHLIYQNKVDDDQTVMVLAINSYPHLFSIQHGDWFDAFRMFSSDQERQFGR